MLIALTIEGRRYPAVFEYPPLLKVWNEVHYPLRLPSSSASRPMLFATAPGLTEAYLKPQFLPPASHPPAEQVTFGPENGQWEVPCRQAAFSTMPDNCLFPGRKSLSRSICQTDCHLVYLHRLPFRLCACCLSLVSIRNAGNFWAHRPIAPDRHILLRPLVAVPPVLCACCAKNAILISLRCARTAAGPTLAVSMVAVTLLSSWSAGMLLRLP